MTNFEASVNKEITNSNRLEMKHPSSWPSCGTGRMSGVYSQSIIWSRSSTWNLLRCRKCKGFSKLLMVKTCKNLMMVLELTLPKILFINCQPARINVALESIPRPVELTYKTPTTSSQRHSFRFTRIVPSTAIS